MIVTKRKISSIVILKLLSKRGEVLIVDLLACQNKSNNTESGFQQNWFK